MRFHIGRLASKNIIRTNKNNGKIGVKNKKIKNYKGFTILEAAMSSFLVGVIFTSFLTVTSVAIKYNTTQRDYVIAANLAQEGIEIMRNMRDNNLKTTGSSFFNNSQKLYFDTCAHDATCNKTCNSSNPYCGMSDMPSNFPSRFSRTITISITNKPNQCGNYDDFLHCRRRITSQVTWPGNSTGVTITDALYPWGDKD